MKTLLIDLGNSRLKWALHAQAARQGGVVETRSAMPRATLDAVFAGLARPDKVLAACVAGEEWCAALAAWVAERWKSQVEFARSQPEQLGVRNGYREPASLGVDRWVALIATRARHAGAAQVVDCGTAVTLDALAADGEFRGGVILPGLALQRECLLRGTGAIRESQGAALDCLARATGDAVAAGTLHGLAGAIEHVLDEQARTLGAAKVFITGGDAPALLPLLRRPVTHVPDLVLQGLACMAGEPC